MDRIFYDSVQCSVFCVGRQEAVNVAGFPPFLQKNRIHVWSASYRDLDRHYKVLSGIISTEERDTASLFRNPADTRRYILRHGALRVILSNYIHQNPETVSFFTGKNGKPELGFRSSSADVSFNLSHTSEMVIIGITRNQRIGIDIVRMDPLYQYHDVADYMLTPAEKGFMQGAGPAEGYQVFFRIWALKEAILKTTGETLSMMKDTDTSDSIPERFSFPCCSMKYRNSLPPLFIWQFNSGQQHCCAMAAEIGIPI